MKSKEEIFFKLPIWLQEISLSYYARRRDKKFRHSKYLAEAIEISNQIELFNSKELEIWQLEKLTNIVNFSIHNIPFYKKFYTKNNYDFKSFDEFKELPLLTKQIVRENWKDFQSDISEAVFHSHTSGTTGSSLQLRISAKAMAYERAYFIKSREITGYKKDDKLASFIGRKIMNHNEKKPPFWRFNKHDNQLLFSNWHVSDENLPFYIEKYNSFQPLFVNGYPSFLYLVSEFAIRNNLSLVKPKAIFTGSETLLEHQKETIERAFDSKIFNHFGTSEQLVVAFQNERNQMQIGEGLGYMEVVENEIVGTTFHNLAMPLIRYKIGDTAKIEVRENKRVLVDLEGRKEDFIISRNGKKYGRLDHLFKDTNTIKEAQIIQETIDELLIKIVPINNYDFKLDNIKNLITSKLGNEFILKYQVVEHIPRTKGGKFRFVISKLN